MSAIYNLEPPTKGKVVVSTSLGDVEIELWPKEAPKAVRNFVQLCLEGYYDGTIFHRVIKNFMVQGGDPTGTGSGGDSIYGEPFKDEFHTRIKFNHRGLVACANENQPHSNGTQFFITLEACSHLDRKHTIFGKVVGDSIYNVAHFNELQTTEDDRPLEPPTFISVDVVWNPFEDIVPRSTREEREADAALKRERDAEQEQRNKKKRKRNLGLLSFGEEAGEEDSQAASTADAAKLQSAFDAADNNDPRLVKSGTEDAERLAALEAAEEAERKRLKASVKAALGAQQPEGELAAEANRLATGAGADDSADEASEEGFAASMRAKALEKRAAHRNQAGPSMAAEANEERPDSEQDKKARKKRRDRTQEALQAGKLRYARINPSNLIAQQDTSLLTEFEKRRLEAKVRSKLAREKGDDLSQLMLFKKRLQSNQAELANQAEADPARPSASRDKGYNGEPKPGFDTSLPAAWRIDRFLDDYEDEKLETLASHKLKFEKAAAKRDAMAANFDDNYVVQDPLLDRNEKWNQKEGAAKRSQRAWAAGHEGPLD